MPDDNKPDNEPDANGQAASLVVVGIGASAGGLEAFKTFFANLPTDSGLAFVLIQHLDPSHNSMLVELLQRETDLAVTEAEDDTAITANHVYVIPPNASLTLKDGRFCLVSPAPPRRERRPIDTFFGSLAEDQGENAVAIVLAGTGSDGTLGVREIKAHGGYALAQAEFDNHALEGMPNSAAATGLVDEILTAEAMPEKLASYCKHLKTAAEHKDSDGTRTDGRAHLTTICTLLQQRIGHDFNQYKEKTLIRRIQRRMQVLQIETMEKYTEHLRAEPRECEQLFHELLIGVTQFFRDPDAWAALNHNAIEPLLEGKGAADTLRVWVPGCATGEEAYTVAILLQEALERRDARPRVQIFGTDIDSGAVEVARTGRYKALPGIDAERLERWFVADGDAYCPAKTLRELCVFSPHNLIKDPPFSKLDLICCRNLLIYMKTELQDLVLRKFHYSLKTDAWLFLGSSEGTNRQAKLFSPFDKKHRLYQRRDAPVQTMHDFSVPGATPLGQPHVPHTTRRGDDDRIERNARRAMQKHSPAYVVIDRNREILRFSGGETGRYLEPSAGAASLNLISLTHQALRPAVRNAVQKAFTSADTVIDDKLTLRVDGQARAITLIAEPLETSDTLCVVAFQDTGPANTASSTAQGVQPDVAELEQELHTTRSQLNATINDLEATNEEMQSANEEFQSVNEELQSTNEELETSKEELQSVNEELQTINAELTSKNEQLDHANSDLQNLLASTDIATLFLDNTLHVKTFTPMMGELFYLRDSDRGRPITEIATRLDYDGLKQDVKAVLRDLGTKQREVRIEADDATYIMRIRPYRTVDNVIDGVVITFTDITEHQHAEAEKAKLAALVESSDDAIIGKDLDGIIQTWNPGAEKLFGYSPDEAVGQSLTLIIPPDRITEEDDILGRLRQGKRIQHFETVRCCKDGRLVDVSLTISPLADKNGHVVGASKIARDISERRRSERLREQQARLLELIATGASLDECLNALCLAVPRISNGVRASILMADEARQTFQRPIAPELLGSWGNTLAGAPINDLMIGTCGEAVFRGEAVVCEDVTADERWSEEWRAQCEANGVLAGYSVPVWDEGGQPVASFMLCFGQARRPSAWEQEVAAFSSRITSIALARNRANEALRVADRRKNEFIATLAHELRNPLAPLRNGLEIMRQNGNDPEATEKARALMTRQLAQLTHLVDDLLDVSRITRGMIALRVDQTDLISVVQDAVETTRPQVDAAGHTLDVALPCQSMTLQADSERLTQMLINLINNAAKYTPENGQIEIALERRDDTAVICVRDNGMGIAADQLGGIFDIFEQGPQPEKQPNGGLGVGLKLAGQVVELHGGTIEAHSDGPDQGSTFTVQLPLTGDEPEETTDEKAPSASPPPPLSRPAPSVGG